MRSEVGEWLATCVGSPICILLLSWSLLIYQNQPSSLKRRIDVLTVAVITQSLAHQLGLILYAILTLIHPANHFGEICSALVWLLNTSSVLQQLTLTSIAIFAAIFNKEDSSLTKNHLKYHLVSLTVISSCIGFTGILNFESDTCVFLAQEVSPKYGLFVNALKILLLFGTICGLCIAIFKDACRSPKSELLQSVSDLSDTSSKNSGFEHQHHWDPSNGSFTSGSTNSRACLRKRKTRVDESGSKSTVFSILFVCYVFDHLPVLVISIRPELLQGFCTPQNIAIWLPLIKDTLLPVFLAIFDKMFCRYVAKVYTKQDNLRKLAHCGVDGKFRHFEQDAEYKLQLNLNHGLKFPLTNGSLYGRLHNHQNPRTGTITMGIQHYPRTQSLSDDNYGSLPAELTSFTSSTFEPRQLKDSKTNSIDTQSTQRLIKLNENFEFGAKRKIGSTDVFGQNMENLVQLDEPKRLKQFARSLDEIREEVPKKSDKDLKIQTRKDEQEFTRNLVRRNASFDHSKYLRVGLDSRTYDIKDLIRKDRHMDLILKRDSNFEEDGCFDSSDDGSCDFDNENFDDTLSSCKSRSRSCCSVTTVANDDFEFFQRKGTKPEIFSPKKSPDKINMRSFTPKIIDDTWIIDTNNSNPISNINNNNNNNNHSNRNNKKNMKHLNTKPTIHSYHLKKISPGFSMNDLDKLFPEEKSQDKLTNASLKNTLKSSEIYHLDNGDCRHNIGGSVPDFKKIFISECV
ncbi:uncharacterized protein LOC130664639 isoform X2 [Microplitis mediator]|uniref:uncharacterized protein LOC130664639 isoform X2 n=1 Tax=Microplitis mediator TaxID=375433 RepID=UPI002555A354|nr:uncharacterized protein LOC130664639 isoform X2 [Microplitis mediator]